MNLLNDIKNNNASNLLSSLLEKCIKSKRISDNKVYTLCTQIEELNSHLKIRQLNFSVTNLVDIKQVINWGNKILNFKEIDLKTELGLNAVLLALQDVAQSDLSEDEKKITEWLSELKLLKGIPLKYIVPFHQLLPNESIRFFIIDQKWINNLVNGVLSIGNNQSKADEWHDNERNNTLYQKANIYLHNVHLKNISTHLFNHFSKESKHQLLKQKFKSINVDNSVNEISGFIMRSDFVEKYPGVRIIATNLKGEICPVLSTDIIGKGIKLCLFEGLIYSITFYENSDSLVYKVDKKNSSSKLNRADGVLDIIKLVEDYKVHDSAHLADKLLCGPEKFTFKLEAK